MKIPINEYQIADISKLDNGFLRHIADQIEFKFTSWRPIQSWPHHSVIDIYDIDDIISNEDYEMSFPNEIDELKKLAEKDVEYVMFEIAWK